MSYVSIESKSENAQEGRLHGNGSALPLTFHCPS